jgi:cellobiose-specific phosphotransferase system component IIB
LQDFFSSNLSDNLFCTGGASSSILFNGIKVPESVKNVQKYFLFKVVIYCSIKVSNADAIKYDRKIDYIVVKT